MQDPNKVKLVDASPDTREKLKIFLSTLKLNQCTLDGKDVKTLEDAVLYAIEQAQKVPYIEKELTELENSVVEISYELGNAMVENEQLKKTNVELETQIREQKKRIEELEKGCVNND